MRNASLRDTNMMIVEFVQGPRHYSALPDARIGTIHAWAKGSQVMQGIDHHLRQLQLQRP